jgi:hypothetical protein
MPGRLELEIGAQIRAAVAIHERIPAVEGVVTRLAGEVESAATGFRGAAAASLVDALDAWFTAAAAIPARLAAYAAALASVDQRTAASEDSASSGYGSLRARMEAAE